jgi:ribosomal protein L25 (general stress protein Ctc)
MNHSRRSAQGTIATRQLRTLTYHLPAQVFGRRAPGAPTPAPT